MSKRKYAAEPALFGGEKRCASSSESSHIIAIDAIHSQQRHLRPQRQLGPYFSTADSRSKPMPTPTTWPCLSVSTAAAMRRHQAERERERSYFLIFSSISDVVAAILPQASASVGMIFCLNLLLIYFFLSQRRNQYLGYFRLGKQLRNFPSFYQVSLTSIFVSRGSVTILATCFCILGRVFHCKMKNIHFKLLKLRLQSI